MEKSKITKQESRKMIERPGKVRGEILRLLTEYIKEKKGEDVLRQLKKEMEDTGYPFDFDKVKRLDWYPIGMMLLIFTILERSFNWEDKDVTDMGDTMPKVSFIAKIYMKYFRSPQTIFEIAPRYWRKMYTIGTMESTELNEKEKYVILRLKDFKLHRVHCILLRSALKGIAQLVGVKNVTVKETKCIFKGDPYHEFIVKWE